MLIFLWGLGFLSTRLACGLDWCSVHLLEHFLNGSFFSLNFLLLCSFHTCLKAGHHFFRSMVQFKTILKPLNFVVSQHTSVKITNKLLTGLSGVIDLCFNVATMAIS